MIIGFFGSKHCQLAAKRPFVLVRFRVDWIYIVKSTPCLKIFSQKYQPETLPFIKSGIPKFPLTSIISKLGESSIISKNLFCLDKLSLICLYSTKETPYSDMSSVVLTGRKMIQFHFGKKPTLYLTWLSWIFFWTWWSFISPFFDNKQFFFCKSR